MISRSQRSQGEHSLPLMRSLPTGSRQPRVGLPTPLTSFVGRTREIAAIHALLQQAGVRLVTLTGPGGVGKTRVAIRVAEESAGDFSDGLLFVSLAELRDPGLLARTVAASLGLTEIPTQDAAPTVSAFLREQSFLLILDNIEHLLPDVAPVVAAWLSQCRLLSVMATSRSTLRISGEHVVGITPLDVPAQADLASLDQLGSVPSIQLFVDRANAAREGFVLTPAIASDVAAICELLDGLPLAIELAAARMQLLPPGALLSRFERRLPILTGGPVDQPPRLQTMERAISWSYALLTPEEQRVFRRLAVFSGGFPSREQRPSTPAIRVRST